MKFQLFLGTLFLGASLSAQPIITNSSFFQPGSQIIAFDANSEGITDGEDGIDITWDFTSLQSTEISNIWGGEIILPSEANGTDFFNSATVASLTPNGTIRYWRNTETGLTTIGHESENDLLMLSDESTLLSYPFSYGSSLIDNAQGNLSSACNNYTWESNSESEGVGYGTLLLPTGTYENVLKVRRVTFSTRKHIDYDIERENYIVENFWFSPSVAGPLLYIRSWSNNGCPGSNEGTEVTFISPSISTGIISDTNNAIQFEIYPNPAHELALLRIDSKKQSTIQISFTDMLGHEVELTNRSMEIAGTQIVDLNISSLNRGVYFVNILSENMRYTKKLVVN